MPRKPATNDGGCFDVSTRLTLGPAHKKYDCTYRVGRARSRTRQSGSPASRHALHGYGGWHFFLLARQFSHALEIRVLGTLAGGSCESELDPSDTAEPVGGGGCWGC